MSTGKQQVSRLTAEKFEMISCESPQELVRGIRRVYEVPGLEHGHVELGVAARLWLYLQEHDIGYAFVGDAGFVLRRDPDTVRAPDIAFVRKQRLPFGIPRGFAELAPDLAIEILSPSNRPKEIKRRVTDLFTAGTRVVWIIDPQRRRATVWNADGVVTLLQEGEYLDGGKILPGFRLRVFDALRGR